MTNSKKEDIGDDGKMKGSVHENQTNDEVVEESSLGVSSTEVVNPNVGSSNFPSVAQGSRRSGIHGGLAERLRCIFRDEEDGDLLLQQSDLETNVLQWLQALDLQVIGACRADERLKPLLKLKVSSGVAEDRLLAHLSQHFEVPEVGMLARCLCIPLVSIRVGKVFKQGAHLCPTATRGHLNLTLLPSSDLRISFVGDDGCVERLTTTLSRNSEGSAVVIEEIPEDISGRSFLLKFQFGKVSYFWCSEQSKPLGLELLAKMKDLLRGKPSLAQLTGISEPRLECFANQLRADLIGSAVSNTKANPTASDTLEWDSSSRVSSSTSKPSRSRQISCPAMKPHSLCQSSLSPRSITFKDGAPRNFSTARSGSREKFRRRGDNHCSISGADTLLVASTSMTELSDTRQNEDVRIANVDVSLPISSLSFLETVRKSVLPPSSELPPLVLPLPQVPTPGSLFPPYYCWCPPCPSTLQYTVTSPHLPFSSIEAQSLPSLSSLLSAARSSSSLVPPNPPLNLADLPSLDFPAFLPDPVAKIPLPVSSFITIPSSEQIPTFTPLTCDPIVHIPIIDFCSSGQRYLVSAGPAISTTSSPFHSKLVNPMIPDTESLVEKSARETLRLLLGSSQTNPQLMEVFPSFLTSTDGVHSPIVVGSRGLYSSTRDVTTIANSIAALGLVSLPQRSIGCEVPKRHNSDNDGDNDMEKQPDPFEVWRGKAVAFHVVGAGVDDSHKLHEAMRLSCKRGGEMGLDAMKTGVHILKGLNFSIKTCYRLVRNHPSILGIMLIFYLLYRFLPSVFKFLLHSSPVFICTSVLLATLVASGNRDPPKVEDKLQRRYSRRTRVKKDDHIIEEKEITSVRTLGRKMIDIKEEVETTSGAQRNKGKARGRRVTFSPIHDYGFISRTIQMDDQPKEIHGMSEIFTRDEKPLIHDVSIADDQDVKEEISKPVDEISDSRSRDCLKEHDENVESSKSVSDHTEISSSSKASIATTNPVIDEPPPVPDSQTPQPVLISINEFDGAPEESNDCSEESEVEQGKNGSKAAVSWTVDDEKNLMDLGCSEVERNKRLESLMARRRARKTMRREADKNLLGDFDCNDAPYQIAPLSIIKNKTFAQSYIENETGGMQPVPGSAPSVLIPRKNPFDLPYDPHEEKPNLTGDSFSQEFMTVFQKDIYCRHESFCFGSASSSGGLKQDKCDTRISAFFIPEDIAPSSGQRQLSDTSDSVSSSVPETELQSSIADQEEEQKQVIEQEGDLISNIDHSPHYVEEMIQPPEVDLVENHHEQTRDTDYSKAEINLPNTSEAYINPDVVEEKFSELKSSSSCSPSSSSSPSPSPSSEMNEKFLHEDNTGVVGSLNIEPTTEGLSMAVENSNLKNDVAAVDYSIPSAIEKRTIDESLFCVDKGVVHTSFPSLTSFPSIASDMQVEVSEVGSPPLSVERTISLTDGECFQYNESVKSDISSGSEGHWTASSGLCAVDETESNSREVNEISESDVIKAGLLGADDESDEPVVTEPAFEQVRIDSNSTSYPTEGKINQIPASSAEPKTNAGVGQLDSEEKVDPIASSYSPAQILVERSTVELSTSNGLQDSTSLQMSDLKGEVDPIASSSLPVQPPPSDRLQHSFQLKEPREEDAVNKIPSSSAGPETNVGVLQLENSMVEPPSNDAVQHSTSSQVKERTEEDASNQIPGSSVEPEMNIGLHQLDSEEKLDTVASSALPAKHLLENSMVQSLSNDAVQHSTSSQTKEPTEGDPIRQIPASNAEPEMHVRDEQLESEEKVEPVPSSSSPAEHLYENLMVRLPPDDGLQPSTSTHIKEPTEGVVISQIPASSGEPETRNEFHRLGSEERVDPIATSSSPVQLLVEKSTCQQPLNGDVGEVTQTTSMVQPSSNSDIDEVTQVSSEFHPSPSDDLYGERQISLMVQESLNGDVHEVKQVNTMVQPSPNGDIHEESQVCSIMHPSPDGDLHEETQVSSMVQPSPDGDIHEEKHVSEMVQPSLNGDLHEVTQASSMVQPSSNGDIHEETHGSEMVQPSLNGDLHEETQASSMVQPTTNVDHDEVTQVNTMVQPSPNVIHEETQVSSIMHPSPDGDLLEEKHVSEMVQPSLNGDLHEEAQVSSMVQPSPNGDIHKETHVSEMVQPSLNGDLHEETQTSLMVVQPTLNGDIQEKTHVSEMVQPSLNGDLPEETQASSVVQPTTNVDRHEVIQVSTMVQPSRNGDIHEETQVSSIMHPSPDGDLHEETHVSEMVQPSLKGDLHEETQASSMVQPTTSGDRHEVTQEPSIMSTEETGNSVLVAHNTEKPKSSIEDAADISDKSSQDDVTMNLPQTKATEGDANNVNKLVIVDDEDKPKPLSIEEVSDKSVEHGTPVNSPQKLLSESGVSSDDRPTGIQKQDSEADHVDNEISSNINTSSSNSHKDVPPEQEVLEIPMESQEESSPAKSPQQQYLIDNEGLRSLLR